MGNRFKIKWEQFRSVLRNEYKYVFNDGGVILVLVMAMFIYSIIYSLAYSTEVVRDIPIAVIDESSTPASRQLIRMLDAAPNMNVDYTPSSMTEAESLFYARKIYGIIYVPSDYEEKIMGGIPAIVGVYMDASYFLMYRQVFTDAVTGLLGTGAQVEFSRLVAQGIAPAQALTVAEPVQFKLTNLFNPYLGYGTFVIPAIIILIIQQTLLLGIGMIGGTWREFGLYKKLCPPGEKRLSTVPLVLGKTTAYLSIYAVTATIILTVHYKIFGFPMNGRFVDIILFMIPYVLSCIFLGIAISTLFRYRENSLLFMLWMSIPLLLISGASLPREMIPDVLYYAGKVFPSSSGTEGFLRLQTMGASLQDVSVEVVTLWILAAIYFVLACVGIRVVLNKKDVTC